MKITFCFVLFHSLSLLEPDSEIKKSIKGSPLMCWLSGNRPGFGH